ncbi:MAG: DNA mismatch repair protein MutL, partial [Saprospiraceae bacterium]|nr:DNA mismatch repair protein MutL [Saprospiraceae bacterium]
KNLFYNIPARRKFLKSNTVEFRHILDEFQRIAIAHPEIHFEAFHNGAETYHLPPGSLRKRLVNLFSKGINDKLVPIEEETDLCKITGFVGKPDSAKKTRGEQFFLLNDRFIKSPYLNHAVQMSYENLINPGTYPFYLLSISIDPERVDINVHPTKQEVKFEDESLVYNIIKSAVKHALNQYNIAPSLDFEQSPAFSGMAPSGNPVTGKIVIPSSFSRPPTMENWEDLYKGLEKTSTYPESFPSRQLANFESDARQGKDPVQMHQCYIISQIKSGFMLIDQQNAHERILYERYLHQIRESPANTQRLVFPKTIELPAHEASLLVSMLPFLRRLGFEVEGFGKDTFILHGIPAHLSNIGEEENLFHELLEQFRMNVDLDWSEEKKLAALLARSSSIKRGTNMTPVEMRSMIDQLFACAEPFQSPFGKKCFITFELEQLESKFNQ